MASDSSSCPICNAPLERGASRCPNGHDIAADPPGDDINSQETRDPIGGFSSTWNGMGRLPGARDHSNTLFECFRCERLVESQAYHGMTIVPRFCPWCGKPVSTLLGREIDGYRVDEVIGRGGFGIVYLVSNITQPKMKAVIKFLRPALVYSRPELVRIFVEEARLTEEIGQTCWNVVRVSNVREHPWPYFFMEYIRGVSLEEYIPRAGSGNVSLDECKGFLRGIAKALAATHAHGRMHRDLKPQNIMVITSGDIPQPEERIKLTDFGLAMRIASARADPLFSTTSGSHLSSYLDQVDSPVQSAGTPEYMPPEAFDGINDFTGDIYSFGVTAYEILTGERPWEDPAVDGNRFFYWREAHKQRPPRPLRALRPDTPSWLARVITRCLEKDPRQRIAGAKDLQENLRDPVKWWIWAASAAAALLLVVLSWRFFSESRHQIEWPDGVVERRPGAPARLWIRNPAELASVDRVAIKLPETLEGRFTAGDFSWSASNAAVMLEEDPVDQRRLRVRFRDGPGAGTLAGATLRIGGSRRTFLKTYRIEGDLEVGADPDPPVVGPPSVVLGKEARELGSGRRLNTRDPRVRLEVRVDEPNLERVELVCRPSASEPRAISGKPVGESGIWSFSLKDLEDGDHSIRVKARDRAGNECLGEEVLLICDYIVQPLGLRQDREDYIAGGRVFYRFSSAEPIQSLELQGGGPGDEIEILELPEAPEKSLDLARVLEDLRQVTTRPLDARRSYLLSIPPGNPPREAFEIGLRDTAEPANEVTLRLRWSPPTALGPKDVARVSVLLSEEKLPAAYDPGSVQYRLEKPTRSLEVQGIELELEPGRVHRVKWKLEELEVETAANYTGAALANRSLKLESDAENRIRITLLDPLERKFEFPLLVTTDTKPPEIHAEVAYKDPRHFRVDSPGDVTVRVTSKDALGEVKALGLDRLEGKTWIAASTASDGRAWTIKLDGLEGRRWEGEHSLRIHARDLASNDVMDPPVVGVKVNSGSPEVIKPPEIKGWELFLEVSDGNIVDHEKARVTLNYRRLGDSSIRFADLTLIPPPEEGSNLYRVDLSKADLPDCAGEIHAVFPDRYGLAVERSWKFEFQRPRLRLRPGLTWRGVEMALVEGEKPFYIGRHEVSNATYTHPSFLRNGAYLDKELRERYGRPKYFGPGGELPVYSSGVTGAPEIPGDDFPVVGISFEEARGFARKVLGGDLPTLDEFLLAAWKETDAGSRYPWPDHDEARDAGRGISNCYGSWEQKDSRLGMSRPRLLKYLDQSSGWKEFRAYHIRTAADPIAELPAEKRRALGKYSGAVLHLVGNVGELVMRNRTGESFGIAGGDFDTRYETINLQEQIRWNPKEYDDRSFKTGFRVVVRMEEASEEFKRLAQHQQETRQ